MNGKYLNLSKTASPYDSSTGHKSIQKDEARLLMVLSRNILSTPT